MSMRNLFSDLRFSFRLLRRNPAFSAAAIVVLAMGIGAMTAVMLGLPLTAVLLTSVFMAADGLALVPLVIVAVCVAYVASAH